MGRKFISKNTNMNPAALENVQNLYTTSTELWRQIQEEKNLDDPLKLKEATRTFRQFSSLLRDADWRYMGGEDVLEGLQNLEREVSAALRDVRRRLAVRNSARASVKRKVAVKRTGRKSKRG